MSVKYQLAPAQIASWKQQLQQQAPDVFVTEARAGSGTGATAADVEALYAQIRRLQMENTLLKKTGSR